MSPIRILIVEDEVIIAESLASLLTDLGYTITGKELRAESALQTIEKDPPDLALLDIRLKGSKDGIWLGEQIRQRFRFAFIFLTSHADPKTVNAAVAVKPHGYLVKPFQRVDLFTSIELAMANFNNQPATAGNPPNAQAEPLDHIFIKDEYVFVKLRFEDILYVKADGNYLEVQTPNKRHLIRSALKEFLARLPENQFLQVHRSYVVQVRHISSFSSTSVFLKDNQVPLSGTFKDGLMARINVQ